MNPLPTKFNIERLFPGGLGADAVATEKARLTTQCQAFITAWKGREDYLSDAAVLASALVDYTNLQAAQSAYGNFGYYLTLAADLDQNSAELKAEQTRFNDFSRPLEVELAFFELRLGTIPETIQRQFLSNPLLTDYQHFLERIFVMAPHMLSEPEEKIMALKANGAYERWVQLTEAFLAREERMVLTESGESEMKSFAEISSLLSSTTKAVRDDAAQVFNEILLAHRDVAEHELNAILQDKKINDLLRKYDLPESARLQSDDIEPSAVEEMVTAVQAQNALASRFYSLKAKLLGQEKLAYHERNVPVGETETEYSYEAAFALVDTVLGNLDSEFSQILHGFSDGEQIDVYPKSGKRDGACCYHVFSTQPSYILLNHTGRLEDVLTLAHEVGHGINNELIKKQQNALNFGTPLSTAEVASTFMEDFVLQELLKNASEEERLVLLVSKLNDDISTIFRQVALYRCEQELHTTFRERGHLSLEDIGKIFQKHMASYMGEAVEMSEGSENWWVYWSHIRFFFYVYSYASGLLISKALQNLVKEDPKSITKIKAFLASGLSESPHDIFQKLGIDLHDKTFWQRGLAEIAELLTETENLARKLGKIE